MIPTPSALSALSLGRTAGLILLCVMVSTCGDSSSTAPTQPTPPPGRWLGAQTIDAGPPPGTSGTNAIAPRVGMDAAGGAVADFLSAEAIWATRAARGQAWGSPSLLGELPPGAASNALWEPSLAVNRGGVALVTWATQEPSVAGRQVFSRRLDPLTGWTAAERIDAGEARELVLPYAASLALDDSANGLAVWDSGGVVAVRLSAASGWQAPERIAERPSSVPRVFLDGAGRGFATWSLSGEAFARRFEPDRGWTETTRFAPDAGWSFAGSGEMAFDTSGQALLVWQRNQGSTQTSSTWSASYAGGRWSTLGAISASGGRAVNPHVGIDSNGRGVAAWNEQLAGPTFARYERGAWATPQLILSAPGAGPTALAVSAGGDAMVAWKESDTATGRGRVWATRYTGNAWGARESLQASSNEPNDPAVSIDPCGNAVAIWSEFEAGRTRIWANRYETACP